MQTRRLVCYGGTYMWLKEKDIAKLRRRGTSALYVTNQIRRLKKQQDSICTLV